MMTLTERDMLEYGYSWNGMQPLTKEEALAIWDSNKAVCLLYGDDTESYADSREDIENHNGIFGVEKEPIAFILKDKETGETTWGEWFDEDAARYFAESAGMVVVGRKCADDRLL